MPIGARPVQTTVDLTGLHHRALEALARDLFPGEVVRVVILGESDQAIIGTTRGSTSPSSGTSA